MYHEAQIILEIPFTRRQGSSCSLPGKRSSGSRGFTRIIAHRVHYTRTREPASFARAQAVRSSRGTTSRPAHLLRACHSVRSIGRQEFIIAVAPRRALLITADGEKRLVQREGSTATADRNVHGRGFFAGSRGQLGIEQVNEQGVIEIPRGPFRGLASSSAMHDLYKLTQLPDRTRRATCSRDYGSLFD